MVIEPQEKVYYIWHNQIYKGVIIEQIHIEDDDEIYFCVKTHFGLQIFAWWELKDSVEELATGIMHESCYE